MKNMALLIDTNVILDYILTRRPFFEPSLEIMRMCAKRELHGYMAFHSVSNLWYVLGKVPEDRKRKWLTDVCGILRVTGAAHDEVLRAVQMWEFKDFEDCLQDRCAMNVRAEYIVTRNVKDYKQSEVPAVTPEELLKILHENISE